MEATTSKGQALKQHEAENTRDYDSPIRYKRAREGCILIMENSRDNVKKLLIWLYKQLNGAIDNNGINNNNLIERLPES